MKYAIVLAAGESTRLKTKRNKVMHDILNKPMIGHLVDNLEKVQLDKLVVVTGYENESVENYLGDRVEYAYQPEQLGTADAVSKVTQLEGKSGSTLLVFGDCALIQPETIETLFKKHEGHDLTLVTTEVSHPGRFRRIVRDTQGKIDRIVGYNDITDREEHIREIALGAYCISNELLFKYLPFIKDGTSNEELNITKLVEILKQNNHDIVAIRVSDYVEFLGANDRHQVVLSEKWLQKKVNTKHMDNGVTLISPNDIYIGADVVIEEDVTIYPNNHIYGKSHLATGTILYPNSWLDNAVIGEDTKIDSSRITDSSVGSHCTVGPSAHLREHTSVGNNVRVGNFVEFKRVSIEEHSSIAHLVYLGNTSVGKNVNIGCGVVTVNYDGRNKHETHIGDGSFIGSNANLIAPITIGENVVIAAGSTVDRDIETGDMAIARSRTEIKVGYGHKYKNKEEK